jgi:hypothetical protein
MNGSILLALDGAGGGGDVSNERSIDGRESHRPSQARAPVANAAFQRSGPPDLDYTVPSGRPDSRPTTSRAFAGIHRVRGLA